MISIFDEDRIIGNIAIRTQGKSRKTEHRFFFVNYCVLYVLFIRLCYPLMLYTLLKFECI